MTCAYRHCGHLSYKQRIAGLKVSRFLEGPTILQPSLPRYMPLSATRS